MTGKRGVVKGELRQEGVQSGAVTGITDRALNFFDSHARLGWYLAITSSVNVLLNLLNLFF